MKPRWIAAVSVLVVLAVLGWGILRGGGNVTRVQMPVVPSTIYTESDISYASQTVMDDFSREFTGCTLTRLAYAGDDRKSEYQELADQYGADQAIVLLSSFEVGPSGGEGNLNPDSTYDNYSWILVRDAGGSWQLADHGY